MSVQAFAPYTSPFGYQLLYPSAWTPVPRGSTISFIGTATEPRKHLSVMSSQVRETGLEDLESRLLAALKQQQIVVRVDRCHTPRPAVLVEAVHNTDGSRRTYITELLDDGKLARTHMMRLSGPSETFPTDEILEIWAKTVPETRRASVGYRRIGLESRGFAFEFPEDWIVGNLDDRNITLRSPVRRASQPNIVITCGPADVSRSLDSLHRQATAENQLQEPGRWLGERTTSIGNCQGRELEFKKVNRDELLDRAYIWIVEPTARGWSVILARGLATRWLDYRPIFEHLRCSFWWTHESIASQNQRRNGES